VWQPQERVLSVSRHAPTSRLAEPKALNPKLDPSSSFFLQPSSSSSSVGGGVSGGARVRAARAQLVQQLRELRKDPSGGANGGKTPTVTVTLMAALSGGGCEGGNGLLLASSLAALPRGFS
jgi:hypothetical protein